MGRQMDRQGETNIPHPPTQQRCAGDIRMAHHIDGLVQERRNSIANALELRLSCTNPWI